jgi:hypothetical protein
MSLLSHGWLYTEIVSSCTFPTSAQDFPEAVEILMSLITKQEKEILGH